jgi:pimeloyl-ACP methyl ester carboxylesterase
MSHTYRELTYTSQDGLTLFCRDYVPADSHGTVVCLPGLTRNSRDFTALANHLAAHYRVLTPDLRGRGNSQWDPKLANYHPKIYYQDVVQLLSDEVSGGAAAIIGTSLGGILAMSLAAMAADRIAGIVINDIGPEVMPEGVARIAAYVGLQAAPGTWANAIAQVRANYDGAFPDFTDADWSAYTRASHRERPDGTVVADYDPAIGDAMRAAPAGTLNLWPIWAGIQKPVLAIRGLRSDLLSAETFDRMLREKPSLVRIEVPNRGHVPLLTEPAVLAGIDAFLAGIFP